MKPELLQLLTDTDPNNVILGCYLARTDGYSDVEIFDIIANHHVIVTEMFNKDYIIVLHDLPIYELRINIIKKNYFIFFTKYEIEIGLFYHSHRFHPKRLGYEIIECKPYSELYMKTREKFIKHFFWLILDCKH